ncbi:(4Fe-4S)-binding protein [Pedobacter sp.]|uniref:(4Fe-4S)-binding protein n=1 Tax=Pedobacter sp. TaxID=1411316 RepID=UPI00396C5F17
METHEYDKGEITVIWKPQLCQHSGICVKMLPQVYNPKERPWIKAGNANAQQLKNQIEHCPSGALSYKLRS